MSEVGTSQESPVRGSGGDDVVAPSSTTDTNVSTPPPPPPTTASALLSSSRSDAGGPRPPPTMTACGVFLRPVDEYLLFRCIPKPDDEEEDDDGDGDDETTFLVPKVTAPIFYQRPEGPISPPLSPMSPSATTTTAATGDSPEVLSPSEAVVTGTNASTPPQCSFEDLSPLGFVEEIIGTSSKPKFLIKLRETGGGAGGGGGAANPLSTSESDVAGAHEFLRLISAGASTPTPEGVAPSPKSQLKQQPKTVFVFCSRNDLRSRMEAPELCAEEDTEEGEEVKVDAATPTTPTAEEEDTSIPLGSDSAGDVPSQGDSTPDPIPAASSTALGDDAVPNPVVDGRRTEEGEEEEVGDDATEEIVLDEEEEVVEMSPEMDAGPVAAVSKDDAAPVTDTTTATTASPSPSRGEEGSMKKEVVSPPPPPVLKLEVSPSSAPSNLLDELLDTGSDGRGGSTTTAARLEAPVYCGAITSGVPEKGRTATIHIAANDSAEGVTQECDEFVFDLRCARACSPAGKDIGRFFYDHIRIEASDAPSVQARMFLWWLPSCVTVLDAKTIQITIPVDPEFEWSDPHTGTSSRRAETFALVLQPSCFAFKTSKKMPLVTEQRIVLQLIDGNHPDFEASAINEEEEEEGGRSASRRESRLSPKKKKKEKVAEGEPNIDALLGGEPSPDAKPQQSPGARLDEIARTSRAAAMSESASPKLSTLSLSDDDQKEEDATSAKDVDKLNVSSFVLDESMNSPVQQQQRGGSGDGNDAADSSTSRSRRRQRTEGRSSGGGTTTTIYDRTKEDLEARRQIQAEKQREVELKETEDCTFKPAISKTAADLHRDTIAAESEKWDQRRMQRLGKLREEAIRREEAETHTKVQLSQRTKELAAKTAAMDPAARRELAEQRRKKLLEEIEPSFKPRINTNPTTIGKKALSATPAAASSDGGGGGGGASTPTPDSATKSGSADTSSVKDSPAAENTGDVSTTTPKSDPAASTSPTPSACNRLYNASRERKRKDEAEQERVNEAERRRAEASRKEAAAKGFADHLQKMKDREAKVLRRLEKQREAEAAKEVKGLFNPAIDSKSKKMAVSRVVSTSTPAANRSTSPKGDKAPAATQKKNSPSPSSTRKQPPVVSSSNTKKKAAAAVAPPLTKPVSMDLGSFLKRQEAYKAEVAQRKLRKQRHTAQEESKECTFAPRVASVPPRTATAKGRGGGGGGSVPHSRKAYNDRGASEVAQVPPRGVDYNRNEVNDDDMAEFDDDDSDEYYFDEEEEELGEEEEEEEGRDQQEGDDEEEEEYHHYENPRYRNEHHQHQHDDRGRVTTGSPDEGDDDVIDPRWAQQQRQQREVVPPLHYHAKPPAPIPTSTTTATSSSVPYEVSGRRPMGTTRTTSKPTGTRSAVSNPQSHRPHPQQQRGPPTQKNAQQANRAIPSSTRGGAGGGGPRQPTLQQRPVHRDVVGHPSTSRPAIVPSLRAPPQRRQQHEEEDEDRRRYYHQQQGEYYDDGDAYDDDVGYEAARPPRQQHHYFPPPHNDDFHHSSTSASGSREMDELDAKIASLDLAVARWKQLIPTPR